MKTLCHNLMNNKRISNKSFFAIFHLKKTLLTKEHFSLLNNVSFCISHGKSRENAMLIFVIRR